jgi:cobyrinic acid a,c-diamide synthase
VDIDRLIAMLDNSNHSEPPPADHVINESEPVRIGVARDPAFCFYYPENLELLANHGAEIVPFSPLSEPKLPDDLDGLYFGGGYPELQPARLSENKSLREIVRYHCHAGMPIYAECGGFMYLCDELTDGEGQSYRMAGCFPFGTRMLTRRKALGYREIRLTESSPLGPAGLVGRGHEFHYSELLHSDTAVPKVYDTTPRSGDSRSTEGYRIHNTLGSYIHLHFGSNPDMARHFADNCRKFKKVRNH